MSANFGFNGKLRDALNASMLHYLAGHHSAPEQDAKQRLTPFAQKNAVKRWNGSRRNAQGVEATLGHFE